MTKKKHSFFESIKKDCLFQKQFDFWDGMDWNKDMPPYFQRLNSLKDDRSFVILATTVLEYELDRFLFEFIPDAQIIINKNTNLNFKINLLKAFRLIPPQILITADLIRNIRNEFAHNLKIDSFEDLKNSKELPHLMKEMERIWKQFEDEMFYYKVDKPKTILMFKDLWKRTIEALRAYESNVKLFRRETEKKSFINSLDTLSTKIKNDKEEDFIKNIHKYMQSYHEE